MVKTNLYLLEQRAFDGDPAQQIRNEFDATTGKFNAPYLKKEHDYFSISKKYSLFRPDSIPGRSIWADDLPGLQNWMNSNPNIDHYHLALQAVLYNKVAIFDWLLSTYADIDKNELMLWICASAQKSIFDKFANNKYGFPMTKYLNDHYKDMYYYAAMSGNSNYFKYLYYKYPEFSSNLSAKQLPNGIDFKDETLDTYLNNLFKVGY